MYPGGRLLKTFPTQVEITLYKTQTHKQKKLDNILLL